jgi:hypothetical protein
MLHNVQGRAHTHCLYQRSAPNAAGGGKVDISNMAVCAGGGKVDISNMAVCV